mmetsp:Transcript_161621/g.298064  ORF Transcript_161621/g.298064 Transcript_161621/m.298064 type:complete len:1331 (-) Transcript_161621:144-4136(-)
MEHCLRTFFFVVLVIHSSAKYNVSYVSHDAGFLRNDSVANAITSVSPATGHFHYATCLMMNDGIYARGARSNAGYYCPWFGHPMGLKTAQYGRLAGLRMLRNSSWDVGTTFTAGSILLASVFQNVADATRGIIDPLWVSKHQVLNRPSRGLLYVSTAARHRICPLFLASCGVWLPAAHAFTAIMGKMIGSNREKAVANAAELTIGMMENGNRIAENVAAMGSISICVTSDKSGELPGLRALYGFRFASYGRVAQFFFSDVQGLTRSMVIAFPTDKHFSALEAFADTPNTVNARLIQKLGVVSPTAEEAGNLDISDFTQAFWDVREEGIHAIFFLIDSCFYYFDHMEGQFTTQSTYMRVPLGYPSVWSVWQDVQATIWKGTWRRHFTYTVVTAGSSTQFGAWNLHFQTLKTKYWDSFCEWVRGHTGSQTNFISGMTWHKFLSWGSTCKDKLWCWHPFRPGPCVELPRNREHFGNKMLGGTEFDQVYTYFEFASCGPLETDGAVSFDISRASLAQAMGTGSPTTTSILTNMKYGMVAKGISTNMKFYNEKNSLRKYDSPSGMVKLLQVQQSVCDTWLTGWLKDRLIKNVMHVNFQDMKTTGTNSEAVPPACGEIKPPNDHRFCRGGEFYDGMYGSCVPCSPGSYSQAGKRNTCVLCPRGTASGRNSSTCETCAVGFFSNVGSPACSQCSPGRFTDERQSSSCTDCLAGNFASNSGSRNCDECPLGKFQSAVGASDCMHCRKNSQTQSTGSISIKQCDCVKDFYEVRGRCDFCFNKFPMGTVKCEGGPAAMALLQPGYMTWGKPIQFFFCAQCFGREDELQPNATTQKQCPPHSGAAGCTKCDVNWAWRPSLNKCEKCENFTFSIGFSVSCAAFVIFLVIRICPTEPSFGVKTLAQTIMIANVSGPFFSWVEFCQVVFLFLTIDVPWPEYVLQRIGIVSYYCAMGMFEMECQYVDKMKFAVGYMAFVNAFPACVAVFLLIISTPSILNTKLRACHFPSPHLGSNVLCTIFSVFSMMIIFFSGTVPLRSVVQPRMGSHGATTMWRFPFMLLQTKQTQRIRLAGILLLIFWPMVLVVMSALIVYVIPMKRTWITLRRGTISLAIKYKIQYSLCIVLESAVKISMTWFVIVFSRQPAWQFTSAVCAFMVLFFCHITFMPHRFPLHSVVDIFKNMCSILMVFPIMSSNVNSECFVLVLVFITLKCLLVECMCIYQTLVLGVKNIGVLLQQQRVIMESWQLSCHGSSKTTLACCVPESLALQRMTFLTETGKQIPTSAHVEILFRIMSKQNMLMWQLMQDHIKNAKDLAKLEQDFLQENISFEKYALNYNTFLRRPAS